MQCSCPCRRRSNCRRRWFMQVQNCAVYRQPKRERERVCVCVQSPILFLYFATHQDVEEKDASVSAQIYSYSESFCWFIMQINALPLRSLPHAHCTSLFQTMLFCWRLLSTGRPVNLPSQFYASKQSISARRTVLHILSWLSWQITTTGHY